MQVGENIKAEVNGDKLILTVDLKQKGHASKTGKSTIIATSQGNKLIDGTNGLTLGLNLYRQG